MDKLIKIKKLKVKNLKNWEDNPKTIDDTFSQHLKNLIKKNGLEDPLVVDGRDMKTVLGGNMRLKVIKELGWKEVECQIVYPENDKEAVEIALLSNKQFGQYIKRELLDVLSKNNFNFDFEQYNLEIIAAIHEIGGESKQESSGGLNDYIPDSENTSETADIPYLQENIVLSKSQRTEFRNLIKKLKEKYGDTKYKGDLLVMFLIDNNI